MNSRFAITSAAQVHYQISVLNSDGSVARQLPRKRNLILDQGLDAIASTPWADVFTVAVLGTGTTPTKRDSGATTFTRTGSTVTASAGFFEAADVGRLLKFDSGEEVRISAYTDPTTVTTSTSGAIAAAEGTVWYVNQTGLFAESKRSNTYSTGGGECGSTFSAGVWTHKRTFIFSAETGTVTYREIGWASTTGAGANLFGRDLLAGVGVTLVNGQQLKVSVELTVAYAPYTSAAWANVITGWSTNGTHGIESSLNRRVSSTGGAVGFVALEPSGPNRVYVSDQSAAIAAMSSNDDSPVQGGFTAANSSASSYSAGSFTRSHSGTFGVGSANGAIRSLLIGHFDGTYHRYSYRVLLSAPETKANTHTLSITFTFTWGRVLSNA